METMQPTMKCGRNVWDEVNMPKAEFQRRTNRIQEELYKQGIDVALLYGSGMNEYGNPCYLSNFLIKTQRGAVTAITRSGETALLYEGSSRDLPDTKPTVCMEEVRPCENISRECIKYLGEKNLMPSTIGLAGFKRLMPYSQVQAFYESIGQSKIVDFNFFIRDMRMVKSWRECDQIRRASRIISRAFKFILQSTLPEMNERLIEALVRKEVCFDGAEDFRMLIANPIEPRWSLRPVEDKQISPGNSIIFYLAIEFERYWAEGIRTFIAEPFHFVELDIENANNLYEWMKSTVKPGIKSSKIYERIMHEVQERSTEYIGEYGLAQGIGLSLHEAPFITEEDNTELREGMCLTIRLALRDKNFGSLMIGNTVNLLKDGAEVLTG